MSEEQISTHTLDILRTVLRRTVKLSLAMQACSIGIIIGMLAAPAVAQIAGASEILTVSRTMAEGASLDVTRLALQVAIVAMIVGLLANAALLRIIHAQAQRPCALTSEQGKSVVESIMREAMRSVQKEREV